MKFKSIDFSTATIEDQTIISKSYDLWKEVYTPILASAGEKISPEYFYRARALSVIHSNNEPLALTLHTNHMINVNGVEDLGYFAPVPKHFIKFLKMQNHNIATCEWVTVRPDLRGRNHKIPLSHVMVGLAFEYVKSKPYTACMGLSRTDLKADKLAEKFGIIAHDTVMRHNIECKVMFCQTQQLHDYPDPEITKIVKDLWQGAEVNIEYTINQKTERVAA